jgi:hypothetical protein
MNNPPVNDQKPTEKKFPLILSVIVFFLIGIIGVPLWFLLSNKHSQEVNAPENLKDKLDSYLREKTSLRTQEAKFYNCSRLFSTETVYVAHVILSDPELNPNNGYPRDGKQLIYPKSQRIRAAFHPDRNWSLTGLTTKPTTFAGPCKADE